MLSSLITMLKWLTRLLPILQILKRLLQRRPS